MIRMNKMEGRSIRTGYCVRDTFGDGDRGVIVR